jgi:hypothetical protein
MGLSSFAAPDAGGVGGWADSSIGLGYGSSASKNAHMYAKMALNILEKVAPSFSKGNSSEGQRKRKRSDSESVSGSGSSSFSFRGSDYGNNSGSTAAGRQSRGFYAPQLKVHKNENFFGFDFEFCTFPMLVMHK